MAGDRRSLIALAAAALLLLWPAVWNGYPIVFADTGTYLSQAIHRYAGWDRPVFYSVFMLPLHATVTVWPVIVVQAVLAVYVLHLLCRLLLPALPPGMFLAGVAALTAVTWLPWLVSELMPDLFTPLLVLLLAVLAWSPEGGGAVERWLLVGLTAFMIASQQSSLPLACVLLAGLALLARCHAARPDRAPNVQPTRAVRQRLLLVLAPPLLAVIGLCGVNLLAHGRFAISPFGNLFLLARVIYDGPGMTTLRRDCPTRHWRLCPLLDRFPPDSDGFLWDTESPLNLAGGPKLVSQDAGAIIAAAWQADPAGVTRAALRNVVEQLRRFASGDGLEPWPNQVTPWIERDFPPRERAAYAAAAQQQGGMSLPPGLATLHAAVALLGVLGCVALLPAAFRRRSRCLGFLVAVLLALPVSAAITGGLSTPHDRYQSRIMWLPPLVALLSLAALRRSPGPPGPRLARVPPSRIAAPRHGLAARQPPAGTTRHAPPAAPAAAPSHTGHATRPAGIRRDALWSGIEAAGSAGFSILTSFAIARIIGPAELGIGAAAAAVHVVLWVVVNALFADALVQRPTVNDRVLSSAFWASGTVGCLAMALQAGSGWGLAWALDDPRLLPMALVLAVPLPLVGAAGVIQGLLTRERAYRTLAMRTLIGQGLGTVVGVSAALAGAGGWALVCQQAVTSGVGAAALLLGRGWRPSWCIDQTTIRSLLRLGVPLTASTLVLIARYRLFAVLIGASAGPAVLGQVHVAFRLVDTVRELTFTALWRLMLPALSEHQHDRAAMLLQVDRWLRRAACVIFPLCVLLAVMLTQVVQVLMGPGWAQAGQAAVPLVGLMAISALTFPGGVALVAAGQARFTLYGNIAALLLGCGGVLLFRPTDPWHAVMIWSVSQLLVVPYGIWMNARALGVPPLRPLSGGARWPVRRP